MLDACFSAPSKPQVLCYSMRIGKGSRKLETANSLPTDSEFARHYLVGWLTGCVQHEDTHPTNPQVIPKPGPNGKSVAKMSVADAAKVSFILCVANSRCVELVLHGAHSCAQH